MWMTSFYLKPFLSQQIHFKKIKKIFGWSNSMYCHLHKFFLFLFDFRCTVKRSWINSVFLSFTAFVSCLRCITCCVCGKKWWCAPVWVCMCVCARACVCVHVCVCVHMHMCVCVSVHMFLMQFKQSVLFSHNSLATMFVTLCSKIPPAPQHFCA